MGLLDRLTLSPVDSAVLTRIAVALERIADHLEGKTPPVPLPDPEPEPLTVAQRDETTVARFWQVEQELFAVLGRPPDPEEIAAVADGVEWDDEDARRLRDRQQVRKEATRLGFDQEGPR